MYHRDIYRSLRLFSLKVENAGLQKRSTSGAPNGEHFLVLCQILE